MTNGNFVLKLFTMFEQKTIDLIYLLYRTFRQVKQSLFLIILILFLQRIDIDV
jgi:hypothetical protein